MPLFEITTDALKPLTATTFSREKITERGDLQRLLRANVEAVAPGALVIAEEFGEWEESRRRIDLLAVDRSGALVVIELKRTEDGGHMELQALRYAAMVSAMTFAQAVDHFASFLKATDDGRDAEETLRDHIEADDEEVEELFGQTVRVVLASAEFGKELTTAVLWLNEQGLDITCVRMRPYRDGERILLDVQPIIPLPEAASYTTGLREKKREEQKAKKSSRDLTRYDVTVGGVTERALPKRRAVLAVVQGLVKAGVSPEAMAKANPWRSYTGTFASVEGTGMNHDEVLEAFQVDFLTSNRKFRTRRWFVEDDERFELGGRTFLLKNGWGLRTLDWMENAIALKPEAGVLVGVSGG